MRPRRWEPFLTNCLRWHLWPRGCWHLDWWDTDCWIDHPAREHLVNFLPHLLTLMSDSFFTLRGITSAHCTYKGFDLIWFFIKGRALQEKLLVNQIWPWFPFPLKLAAVQVVEDLRSLPPIILTSAPVSHTTGGSRWLRRVASLLSAAHFLFLFTAISSRRPAAQISTVRKICKADSMNLR